MSDEDPDPREQARLCWQICAELKRSTKPNLRVHAPLMEITARAWERIAARKEQENKEGDGDDAA